VSGSRRWFGIANCELCVPSLSLGAGRRPVRKPAEESGILSSCAVLAPLRGERPISEFVCLVLGTLYTVDQNGNVTSQTPDTGASAKPVEIGCLLGLV
jgi:hypothetical protein